MRSPLAGSRAAARRLAELRRRPEPAGDDDPQDPARPSEDGAADRRGRLEPPPGPPDAAARIDAARARLRATIEPPPDDVER